MKEINFIKPAGHTLSHKDNSNSGKAKILIVEDEALIALDLQRQLELMGYSARSIAASGEDAILIAKEENPDLVLLDIALSGPIDGIEAAGQIRLRSNIPVIYLTAHSDEETLRRAKLTGPYGYLIKPVGNRELHSAIEIVLIKHRAGEALIKSEERYRTFMDSTGDMSVLKDEEFRYLIANKAATEFFGKREDEIIGKTDFELLHEGIAEVFRQSDIKALQAEDVFVAEERVGDKIYESRRFRVRLGNAGKYGVGSYMRDITELKKAAEVLKESEQRFRNIFEEGPLGVAIIDLSGRFVRVNAMFCRMSGYTEKELTSLTYRDITHPDHLAGDMEHALKLAGGEIPYYKTDKRYIKKDRDILWVNLTATLINDDNRRPLYYLTMVEDITERKNTEIELLQHRERLAALVEARTSDLTTAVELLQEEIMERRETEDALRESEKRYRELFNYMSSGVAVFEAVDDGSDFIFKDFNSAGEQIDKISRDKLLGKKVSEVFPGIRDFGLFEVFQRVWQTGKPEFHPVSYYKDGRTEGWRENYVYRLPSGEIVSVYDDMTEQLQMAERETKLLRELKTIFDNFPVGIVYLNNNFEIISTNRFINDLTGLDEGSLTGRICYETLGEFADDPVKKGAEKICSFCKKDTCFKTNKTTFTERPWRDKYVRVTTVPESDENGTITRFMEIVEDITGRKRAEAEAIRASHLAALGELAAGVAHEINNPINGIINYTQILLNKSNGENKEHDIARRIIKEGDRIATIVRNLLSFARRDNRVDKIPAGISDILSEALGLTEMQLIKDGIKLNVKMPADLPVIIVQPQQLEQVFLNIISNARYALNSKYEGTHEDKLLEIISEKITIGPSPYIHVVFHDRGTGIRPDILDKIMNPFFSTKPGHIGTGLGLSISHGIVSDHGGRLLIDSVEGEYTRVTVELPVRN